MARDWRGIVSPRLSGAFLQAFRHAVPHTSSMLSSQPSSTRTALQVQAMSTLPAPQPQPAAPLPGAPAAVDAAFATPGTPAAINAAVATPTPAPVGLAGSSGAQERSVHVAGDARLDIVANSVTVCTHNTYLDSAITPASETPAQPAAPTAQSDGVPAPSQLPQQNTDSPHQAPAAAAAAHTAGAAAPAQAASARPARAAEEPKRGGAVVMYSAYLPRPRLSFVQDPRHPAAWRKSGFVL